MNAPGPSISFQPVLWAAVSAVLWGLWWIPVRYMETLGLHGAWSGLVLNMGAAVVLGAGVLLGLVPLRLRGRAIVGACFVGCAFTTYSIALAYSEVVRVVLLFYLAPIWSKIIEWAFLRMGWRWTTTLGLVAALTGAYLMLGGDLGTLRLNFGDVLAVLSGMSWATGAALVFAGGAVRASSLSFVCMVAAVCIALPFAVLSGWPTASVASVAPVSLGLGAVYTVPIIVMTLWAAQRLAPTTLTFLLTAEILSGVISSAIFLDEPFGWMQAAGTALIIFAALSEVLSSMGKSVSESR